MMSNRLIFQALVFGFVLAMTGCGSDDNGTAGSGGSGTAGTGGSGTAGTGGGGGMATCEATAQEVCTTCDAVERTPECESRFDACLLDPPSGNFCEKCAAIALEQCGAL
jgi:hypothetical protein